MINLLIIDDEPEILDWLYDIVRGTYSDFQIFKTFMPIEAKRILQSEIIDVLFTDIKMPGIDGIELSKLAKEANSECRVIFLTGYTDFNYAYEAVKIGCDDFIMKINSESEILSSLEKVIQQIRQNKEVQELILAAERQKLLSRPDENGEQNKIVLIKNYIWDNIDKEISLRKLAGMVYLNPAYLSRLFKSETGVTLSEYVINVRIQRAKELLRESNMKILDIAAKVGLDSPVYFSRVFKKEVNLTPQKYREQHISTEE